MKYTRTIIFIGLFLFVCFLQLKCVQNVDVTMEKRDSAAREDSLTRELESFPDHSKLDLDSLHDAQMNADWQAINEEHRRRYE